MVRLRPTFLTAASHASRPTDSRSILPACARARHIGNALVVSGLVGVAPLYPVSPLTAILEHAPDNDVDLSQAKHALKLLAALGDGFVEFRG